VLLHYLVKYLCSKTAMLMNTCSNAVYGAAAIYGVFNARCLRSSPAFAHVQSRSTAVDGTLRTYDRRRPLRTVNGRSENST